jgi:hypothetical protein
VTALFYKLVFLLKWPLTLGVVFGLFGLAYVVHGRMHGSEERKAEPRASQQPPTEGIVKFAEATAQALGLHCEPADKAVWQERVTIYGRVVPNPAATAEVRAPAAGMLRTSNGNRWPAPGQAVKAGQVIGQVEVRIGVLEQLDLQTKLAEAQVKERQAEEILDRRRRLVERYEKAPPETVTGLQKDEARVQLAEAQLQVDSARAVARLWRQALGEIGFRMEQRLRSELPALLGSAPLAGFPAGLPWRALAQQWRAAPGGLSTLSVPLVASIDGEVADLTGQADTAIAQDGPVLRIVDFRRTRVRLDLPMAVAVSGGPEGLDLEAVAAPMASLRGGTDNAEGGKPGGQVRARRLGPAPEIDAALQCARYWYEIDFRPSGSNAQRNNGSAMSPEGGTSLPDSALWRPGLFVKAQLQAPNSTAVEAVSVPASAVLNHQGRTLVYVRLAPGQFARREVQVLGRSGGRCYLAPRDITENLEKVGVDEKEDVVVTRAQILLSEEFRSIVDVD